MPAGQFIMSVSLPNCHRTKVADIVQTTATSGLNVYAAIIATNRAARKEGQLCEHSLASSLEGTPCGDNAVSFSLLIPKHQRIYYHRASATVQRWDHRQQAGISSRLSDVLLILFKENTSSIPTSH
jgi:hypothetical protein